MIQGVLSGVARLGKMPRIVVFMGWIKLEAVVLSLNALDVAAMVCSCISKTQPTTAPCPHFSVAVFFQELRSGAAKVTACSITTSLVRRHATVPSLQTSTCTAPLTKPQRPALSTMRTPNL